MSDTERLLAPQFSPSNKSQPQRVTLARNKTASQQSRTAFFDISTTKGNSACADLGFK